MRLVQAISCIALILFVGSANSEDHFYTTDPKGEVALSAGYVLEGIASYVYPKSVSNTVPMIRWFDPRTSDHFYTTDPNGELAPNAGYIAEGTAFYCFPSPQIDTVPLYRWFDRRTSDHFYTTDPKGEVALSAGYVLEGIACHVYPVAHAGTVPLYRYFYVGGAAGAGDYCVFLTGSQGAIVFRRTIHASSAEEAQRVAVRMLREYNRIALPGYGAYRAEINSGGC
jgi:hypothetical protein